MTIDGLLTFLALLVAVYTITSRAQRLNLSLKIRAWHWAALLVLFVAVHMLELPKVIAALPHVPPVANWVLDPKEVAYLLLIGGGDPVRDLHPFLAAPAKPGLAAWPIDRRAER